MEETFREGSFAIAPPFIHIGNRAIRVRDINGVSVRSAAANAAMGCLWAIFGLMFAGVAFVMGPLGWIIGVVVLFFVVAASIQAFQGGKGLKTIVLRIGAEDIEAYESKNAQNVLHVKALIEQAMANA